MHMRSTLIPGILALTLAAPAVLASAQEAVPETRFGAYTLAPGFLPDPFIVSAVGGGPVDSASLGLPEGCLGFVSEAATAAFTYSEAPSGFRIFFLGDADSTLIVEAPDGSTSCSDDAFGLDPAVEFMQPQPGTYRVWIGTFGADSVSSGYLMLTEIYDSVPGSILTPLVNFITSIVPADEFGAGS